MARQCFDCGATPAEARFPGERKPRGMRDRCTECASGIEVQRALRLAEHRQSLQHGRVFIRTRASYRAALRRRLASPQLDLVDLLVAAP